jgi:cytochrome c553
MGSVGRTSDQAGQGMRARHRIGAFPVTLILAGVMLPALIMAALIMAGSIATSAIAQTASTGSIEDKAAICAVCHGANGVPVTKEIPIIWGQHAGYMFLNLRDMKTGARKNEQMAPIVKDMSHDDMLALAEYFEKKPWPDLAQPSAPADVATHAEAVATSGQCTQCHLGGYLGDSTNPRLAGQSIEYLRKTMQDFRSGARANNPWMTALLKTFPDADIEAMARYLGGL